MLKQSFSVPQIKLIELVLLLIASLMKYAYLSFFFLETKLLLLPCGLLKYYLLSKRMSRKYYGTMYKFSRFIHTKTLNLKINNLWAWEGSNYIINILCLIGLTVIIL